MQGTKESASAKKNRSGVNLEYIETVLIKFYLDSSGEVVQGILETKRPDQKVLDEKHMNEAEAERVSRRRALRGRVRPGHTDTGVEVYHQIEDVSLPDFLNQIGRVEYGIRDVHSFEQRKGRRLWVVVFAVEYGKPDAENAEELRKMFARYAANSWTVSIWDNPNLTTTINCTMRVHKPAEHRVLVGDRIYIK